VRLDLRVVMASVDYTNESGICERAEFWVAIIKS
jgi:hypothetical protein